MKRYNTPVVEINGFEVEDIIAASFEDSNANAAYAEYLANNGGTGGEGDSENTLVFEW